MKKYFAKWLSTEGEIPKGAVTFFKEDNSRGLTSTKGLPDWVVEKANQKGWKAAKMFLCSRDIQVGDKLEMSNGSTFHIKYKTGIQHGLSAAQILVDAGKAWKVIGEISPAAVPYIQEGQEFDEKEIAIKYHEKYKCLCQESLGHEKESCVHYDGGTNKYVDGCYRKEQASTPYEIKIKCPWGCYH